MNSERLEKIVNAVLYEGYILYPYRASSKKNRQRFTFGRVYPEDYSVAQKGAEPCSMQTEVLVRTQSSECAIDVSVRFLHPMAREVGVLAEPIAEMPPTGEPKFELVNEKLIGEKLYQTWQESVERTVELPTFILRQAPPEATEFRFEASRTLEPISDGKEIAAVFIRNQQSLLGLVETSIAQIDDQVSKITIRIWNKTPVPAADIENQDAIVMWTFASTHTVVHVTGGEFISLLEPATEYEAAAKACKNINTWPVLVGDTKTQERDTVLSSPIILYDYPQIAPESAGDLFDGAEIDEILTLRIMTMTDEEKREMRGVDDHARRILERTEMLPEDHLLKMHGVMRGVPPPQTQPSNEDFFNPTKKLESTMIDGVELKAGDKVRIWPKKRADIMDMALEGKVATIEALEVDLENQVHFALVIDDDPGRDMGLLRQSGHRFFYSADEVEPVTEMKKPE